MFNKILENCAIQKVQALHVVLLDNLLILLYENIANQMSLILVIIMNHHLKDTSIGQKYQYCYQCLGY